MTVSLADQIAWATRQHTYAETDLRNSPGASDYSVQCAASVLATLESVPAMVAVIEALKRVDMIAAEMGYPDTLGFHEAKDRILEITAAALAALPSLPPPQEGK